MRFNIFNQIHKALRAMLYETALSTQQTDFTNIEEAEIAVEKISLLLDVFDKHAEHEDSFVLPAIAEYEPSLVDTFENEHVEDHELAENLRALLESLKVATTPEQKQESGHAILHSLIAFMNFNLEHMEKEETVLNSRLWRFYTDREIMAINQKIIASIDEKEMNLTSAWMMKGLSNREISNWLKAVQSNAPEFVFKNLFAIAEKELPNQRFRKVLEDLTEGAMVA